MFVCRNARARACDLFGAKLLFLLSIGLHAVSHLAGAGNPSEQRDGGSRLQRGGGDSYQAAGHTVGLLLWMVSSLASEWCNEMCTRRKLVHRFVHCSRVSRTAALLLRYNSLHHLWDESILRVVTRFDTLLVTRIDARWLPLRGQIAEWI